MLIVSKAVEVYNTLQVSKLFILAVWFSMKLRIPKKGNGTRCYPSILYNSASYRDIELLCNPRYMKFSWLLYQFHGNNVYCNMQ